MPWISAPEEPGVLAYEGPAHLVDGLGRRTVVYAELDVMAGDGSWHGVLTAPERWSRRWRERLILEVDADVALRSRVGIDLVIDRRVVVHGDAHYLSLPPRPSHEEAQIRAAS
jgi:hypothetical protein